MFWKLHLYKSTGNGAACQEEAGAIVQRERGYFTSSTARMQYLSFREQQLPIGSGTFGASAKHLVQQCMQRAGSR